MNKSIRRNMLQKMENEYTIKKKNKLATEKNIYNKQPCYSNSVVLIERAIQAFQ